MRLWKSPLYWLALALCGCSYGGRTYLRYVPTVYVVHIIKWWSSNVGTHPRCVRKEEHKFSRPMRAWTSLLCWLALWCCDHGDFGRTCGTSLRCMLHIIKWWSSERRDTPPVCPEERAWVFPTDLGMEITLI